MPIMTMLRAAAPPAPATAAESTMVSLALLEIVGSELVASYGPARRAVASSATTSQASLREVSSEPYPMHPNYHHHHHHTHTHFHVQKHTITTMQSERLASFELCILGCMSTGVTTFFSISAVLGMQRRNWLTTRRGCSVFGVPHFQRLDIHTGVAQLVLTLMHHCGLVLSNLAAFSV